MDASSRVIRPIVEKYGGIWRDDQPVVVDGNLISSRHPDDIAHFSRAIRDWFAQHYLQGRSDLAMRVPNVE